MRSTVLLLLLLVFLPAAAQRPRRQPAAPPASQQGAEDRLLADQRAIARLQERDIAANTALDADALISLTTDDVVVLPPGRAPVVGHEALRTFYGELLERAPDVQVLAYSENWEEVRIVGDFAFQWGTITERSKPSVSGAETASAVHAMRMLARQPDGSWKIARAMWNAAPAPAASR
ncbi:MAG TPA: DUF4440 domain-containing protein [Terriglobales bacterium]|nr:DUF4440 domain-containing protein [Terriglobales bacterium]